MPIIPGFPKAEIRRITVQGQPWQKVLDTPHLNQDPISNNKLGAVLCACNPIYAQIGRF
jgi:hypothetical protein